MYFYFWTAAVPRGDGKLVIHSENFNETIEARLDSLSPLPEKHWANYPLGVAWALRRAGKPISGANVYVSGEVPLGAGLSSSAAVEVSVALALLNDRGNSVDRAELAQLCPNAEHAFVGARLGMLDRL